jgi:hypothetical protein
VRIVFVIGPDLRGWARATQARIKWPRVLVLAGVIGETPPRFDEFFSVGETDCAAPGWHYPECVNYRPESIRRLAEDAGFRFRQLDWRHPRRTWGLFYKPSFDDSWFVNRPLTWNNWMDYGPRYLLLISDWGAVYSLLRTLILSPRA